MYKLTWEVKEFDIKRGYYSTTHSLLCNTYEEAVAKRRVLHLQRNYSNMIELVTNK